MIALGSGWSPVPWLWRTDHHRRETFRRESIPRRVNASIRPKPWSRSRRSSGGDCYRKMADRQDSRFHVTSHPNCLARTYHGINLISAKAWTRWNSASEPSTNPHLSQTDMKQLPIVICARDGSVGMEILEYQGIRPVTNRSGYSCNYRVRVTPTSETSSVSVLFRDTPDRVRLHAYDLPDTIDPIANLQILAQAVIGEYLDEGGVPPVGEHPESRFMIDCLYARFKEWRARKPATDDEIERYLRATLYWSWQFAHENVEISATDEIRLGTPLQQINRVLRIGEGDEWKVEERASHMLIISPTQALLKSERELHKFARNQNRASPAEQNGVSNLRLFISHSSKDVPYVVALIHLLRSALTLPAEQIRCTSVDGYRLPGGADTQETLRTEIHASEAFIGVISENSLKSLYVTFELGARWGAKKHLLPLLGPGINATILSGPMADVTALQGDNPAQLHQLVQDLAKLLCIEPSGPASYQRQLDELLTAAASYQPNSFSDNDPRRIYSPDPQAVDRLSVRKQVARILYAEIRQNTEHLEEIRESRREDPEKRPVSWPATQPGYESVGLGIGELNPTLVSGVMSFYRGLGTIASCIADFERNPRVAPQFLRDFDNITSGLIEDGLRVMRELEEQVSQ
jgi:hypothetical protein